ncbi:MAG TPA: ComEA family DNA-binding protein [Kofleriaceae bacterium]|nr:ComEA family DNA-binding protein [Kofleriaceae bacterium]
MASTVRQRVVGRLRAARRALGATAVLILAAVALAALVLPPAAEADGPGTTPAVRAAGEGDPAAPPPGPRDGQVLPPALALLGGGPWSGPAPPPRPCGASGPNGKVNINQAGLQELDLLPGIGPAKAKRILEWRARHGRFRRIKDLRRVKGFGRKTVLKLFPYLTVDGPTTATAAP